MLTNNFMTIEFINSDNWVLPYKN